MTEASAIEGFFTPYTDRGVSDDAKVLRTRLNEVRDDMSKTETLGRNYRETYRGLIHNINECSSQNWDGYGAKAVSLNSIYFAVQFLKSLPTTYPSPDVSVDPDGEIAFEWYKKPRYVLSVSIGKHGEFSYAGLFGRKKTYGTEYFGDGVPMVITTNIERLFSEDDPSE